MTFTIELAPETEAGLAALAAAHGVALPDYIRQVLEDRLLGRLMPALSTAERLAAWRDVAGLPIRPPLSEAAISRDSLYDARG